MNKIATTYHFPVHITCPKWLRWLEILYDQSLFKTRSKALFKISVGAKFCEILNSKFQNEIRDQTPRKAHTRESWDATPEHLKITLKFHLLFIKWTLTRQTKAGSRSEQNDKNLRFLPVLWTAIQGVCSTASYRIPTGFNFATVVL